MAKGSVRLTLAEWLDVLGSATLIPVAAVALAVAYVLTISNPAMFPAVFAAATLFGLACMGFGRADFESDD